MRSKLHFVLIDVPNISDSLYILNISDICISYPILYLSADLIYVLKTVCNINFKVKLK